MRTEHLEVLVEEPSMEAFLRGLLPRLLSDDVTFEIYPSRDKFDLLKNLPARLRAYARFLPATHRVVVVVDRDDDDCKKLKETLERFAADAKLPTRKRAVTAWRVVNRIAVEELEAWYFGDWTAVRNCYPRVPSTLRQRAGFRDPDDIRGGTWEAFERVLQRVGYFEGGLSKIEAARTLGVVVDRERTTSHSFAVFCDALIDACRR